MPSGQVLGAPEPQLRTQEDPRQRQVAVLSQLRAQASALRQLTVQALVPVQVTPQSPAPPQSTLHGELSLHWTAQAVASSQSTLQSPPLHWLAHERVSAHWVSQLVALQLHASLAQRQMPPLHSTSGSGPQPLARAERTRHVAKTSARMAATTAGRWERFMGLSILRAMIRLARPVLGAEEARAVEAVLATGMLIQGERVAELEGLVAARTGRRHAVAVSSGTAALELALQAIGVGAGDAVVVPDLTWPSPAHAAIACGARVVLADVDAREWNVTAETVAAARTGAPGGVKAVIAIDQLGNPARWSEMPRDVPVIADAACSLGSTYRGRPCGSFGLIACLSFHPRKVITTGEGGMCLTDDDGLAARMRVLRNHGQRAAGEFVEPAVNWRMSEVAAAIGIVQMGRLDALLARRSAIMAAYRAELTALEWQSEAEGAVSNRQTGAALLPRGAPSSRDQVIAALRAREIEAGRVSYALHRIGTIDGAPERVPASGEVVDRGIALPLHPGMSDDDVGRVVAAVREVLA